MFQTTRDAFKIEFFGDVSWVNIFLRQFSSISPDPEPGTIFQRTNAKYFTQKDLSPISVHFGVYRI